MADRVIDNSGDQDALERRVDDVWEWIQTLPPHADGPVNALTIVLVAAFIALAAADWIAIWRGDDHLRSTTKPAATAVLVLIAALAGEMAGDARAALVVAVLLCLVGDVALLGRSDRHFLAGLSAFALGHLAYVVTALFVGVSWPRLGRRLPGPRRAARFPGRRQECSTERDVTVVNRC